jgi:nucleotide-binding universal stress UspA family protein
MFRKFLHANDGSAGAFRALAVALDLAKRHRAKLHMVSVEEIQRVPGTREEVIGEEELAKRKFENVIKKAEALAQRKRVKLKAHLLIGHPVKAITEFVEVHGFDVLILGYFGHSQLYNMLIGGTAERLVRVAPCSVIVIK